MSGFVTGSNGKIQLSATGKLVAASIDELTRCCCGVEAGCHCAYSMEGLTNYFGQESQIGPPLACAPFPFASSSPYKNTYWSYWDKLKRASMYSSSNEFTFSPPDGPPAVPGRHRAIQNGNYVAYLNCEIDEFIPHPDGNPIPLLNHACSWINTVEAGYIRSGIYDLRGFGYMPEFPEYVADEFVFSKTNLVPANINSCYLPRPHSWPCYRGYNFCDMPIDTIGDFPGNCLKLSITDGIVTRVMWSLATTPPARVYFPQGSPGDFYYYPDCGTFVKGAGSFIGVNFESRNGTPVRVTRPAIWQHPAFSTFLDLGAGGPNQGSAAMSAHVSDFGAFYFQGRTPYSWGPFAPVQFWRPASSFYNGYSGAPSYRLFNFGGGNFSQTVQMAVGNKYSIMPGSEFNLTFTGTWFTF